MKDRYNIDISRFDMKSFMLYVFRDVIFVNCGSNMYDKNEIIELILKEKESTQRQIRKTLSTAWGMSPKIIKSILINILNNLKG